MRRIFPREEVPPAWLHDDPEPATYQGDASQGYAEEHRTLFDPMAVLYGHCRTITTALNLAIGALG